MSSCELESEDFIIIFLKLAIPKVFVSLLFSPVKKRNILSSEHVK